MAAIDAQVLAIAGSPNTSAFIALGGRRGILVGVIAELVALVAADA